MGVNTFLLDRRTAVLSIGGHRQTVGTLRRFFKLTELDDARAAEREAAAHLSPSPGAVLLMDISELPLAANAGKSVPAHLVLGWDEGRGSVTDFGWDYLPKLGYAVRDPATSTYTLYEERDGLLHTISGTCARERGLIDADGRLIAHGQPRITACLSVRPYIPDYVEADCTFDSGAGDRLLVAASHDAPPPETWFIGKTPREVASYPAKNQGPLRQRQSHPQP